MRRPWNLKKSSNFLKNYLVTSKIHRWRFYQIFAVFSGYLNFNPKPFFVCVCWSIYETNLVNHNEILFYPFMWNKQSIRNSDLQFQLSQVAKKTKLSTFLSHFTHNLASVQFYQKRKSAAWLYCHTKVAVSLLLYRGTVE